MWYVLEDTIPANTARADARETSVKVHGGILHSLYVTIPPGSAYLAHMQLRRASYYILPRNEDKSITGEHINVLYREWLELPSPENRITLKTWNLDDTHAHRVRVLVGVEKKSVLEVEERYLKTLSLFMKMFRRRV